MRNKNGFISRRLSREFMKKGQTWMLDLFRSWIKTFNKSVHYVINIMNV